MLYDNYSFYDSKIAGLCRAKYDYVATDPRQHSFKIGKFDYSLFYYAVILKFSLQGDVMKVLQIRSEGWWQCELNGQIGFKIDANRVIFVHY